MSSKKTVTFLLALLLLTPAAADDLRTLFTTPQERQLINVNRYKSDEVKPQPVKNDAPEISPVQQLVREEVTRDFKISGITISREGPHTVWINDSIYEDGQQLEDNIRVKVMLGEEIRVRITAPDGLHYYGTSGETIEVKYLATVKN